MSMILHVNDNNLLVQHGEQLWRSQGYAWLKDGSVFFDIDLEHNAVKNCRLEPQQINSRYWQQCEQTAIPSNASGMRHAADLVWRHLTVLKEEYQLSEVALVVPSHYQAKNLQLLLGIAKSSGLQVTGLVNKAVYALQNQISSEGRYLHIDVQLHQTVCSEVLVEGDLLRLGGVEVLHQVGLQAMQDALLKTIQDRFISSDRFDPLHYAETEQQLFDELLELSERVRAQGKGNVQVRYQGQQHLTSIDKKQWKNAISTYLEQLQKVTVDAPPKHRYYDFNGFAVADLSAQHSSMLRKPPMSSAGVLAVGVDSGGQMIYRTELRADIASPTATKADQHDAAAPDPGLEQSQPQPSPAQTSDPQAASHVLHSGVAIPLTNVEIKFKNNQFQLASSSSSNLAGLLADNSLFVLGDESRTELRVGDRLGSNLADGVLTIIHVASGR